MREVRELKSTLRDSVGEIRGAMFDMSRAVREIVDDLKPKPPKTFASGMFTAAPSEDKTEEPKEQELKSDVKSDADESNNDEEKKQSELT